MSNNKNAIVMKTFYFSRMNMSVLSLFGILSLVVTSCGSFQNSSYYDNDGVYGSDENPRAKVSESNNSGYYKEYFGNLKKDNEVFTNVDSYTSATDSLKNESASRTVAPSNNAGWGSNSSDNVTINIYDNGWNNWGYYNSWAGNNWGWNNGWYGNYWGWNNWYGPNWGWNSWYGPNWGWGWNNWYGPGWYGGWYGGYYGYNYNNWSWYGGNLGHNYAYSGGRRNNNRIVGSNGGVISGGRSNGIGGGRNSGVFGSRDYNNPSPRSNYNNNNTPRSNYNEYNTPRTNNNSPRSNYNETNTPRNNTPRESTNSPRTYTPSSTPTYSSPRASGGGGFSSGGGFGGGGGRSGGGGRR
jgi:hypothetical protein